ncbi:Ger(x)C family spore germination protein [Bacillus atrophaeus]|uniref:Ger(x)C family spore germination protein n=1 Tax=Bacillus atrophaeus TaxID=1452 RepID=UPI00227E47B8|nr:Ger(x)C family spore germination protein [Bacillus atrophaeus]MCY8515351.1 Ger(x)C family spore germination protein [Bacillus atrophaeus]MCY8990164.1 Ger(x)C family spore germination protein [Bacillus atrophaeus]
MRKPILLFILCTILLTGCWDSRNLEDLSLIIGLGLDKPENGKNLEISQQILIPRKISAQQSSSGDPTKISTTQGETVHQVFRTAALKNRPSFSQHLRVILVSKKLLSNDIQMDALLNQFVRDNGTRRSSHVFVVADKAKDILKISDEGDPASNVIYELTDNNKVTIRMMEAVTLGDVSKKMTAGDSFVIPRVGVQAGKIEIDGASVIKNRYWHADLSPGQVQAMNLFTGEVKGGVIDAQHDGELFSYEVYSSHKSIKTSYRDGKFKFVVNREVEGRLSEDWNPKENSFQDSYIKEIEEATKKQIQAQVTEFITLLQDDIKTDITGLGDQVRIHYPQQWRKISKKWDQVFSESDIEYHVKVIVRDFGTKGVTQ